MGSIIASREIGNGLTSTVAAVVEGFGAGLEDIDGGVDEFVRPGGRDGAAGVRDMRSAVED